MQRRFTVESEIWLCDEIRFNSARNLELYFFKRLGATFQHFHPLTSLWEHTPRTSQERRRVERFRLSTTGRMPWRTVKLGSFVLIGAWTISLATWLNAVAAAFFTHIFWSMSIDVNEIFICVAWKGYGLVAHFHTDVFEEREVDFGYLVSFINRLGGWKESVLNIFSLVDVVFEWHIYIYMGCADSVRPFSLRYGSLLLWVSKRCTITIPARWTMRWLLATQKLQKLIVCCGIWVTISTRLGSEHLWEMHGIKRYQEHIPLSESSAR